MIALVLCSGSIRNAVVKRVRETHADIQDGTPRPAASTGREDLRLVERAFTPASFSLSKGISAPKLFLFLVELGHIHHVETLVASKVRGSRRQQLVLAIDQVRGIHRCQFEPVTVGNSIGRAGLDTIAAKNAAVIVDVVDLRIALRPGNPILLCVFCRFDVDAIGGASRRAQEARHALFKPVLISLQNV